jgi:hypothetical protein
MSGKEGQERERDGEKTFSLHATKKIWIIWWWSSHAAMSTNNIASEKAVLIPCDFKYIHAIKLN